MNTPTPPSTDGLTLAEHNARLQEGLSIELTAVQSMLVFGDGRKLLARQPDVLGPGQTAFFVADGLLQGCILNADGTGVLRDTRTLPAELVTRIVAHFARTTGAAERHSRPATLP